MNNHRLDINRLCADLGKDRLLVQGAGGNVSWKEDGVLWVKGSGTWLANAEQEDIFVPVNLKLLQNALYRKEFDVKIEVIPTREECTLRPSIETTMHALMPQKIVVHLHAINALSYLVSKDCEVLLQNLFAQSVDTQKVNSTFVGYHKPGPELAQAIYGALQNNPTANVIFLKNHGIVIGADSVEEIYMLIGFINAICTPNHKIETTYPIRRYDLNLKNGYIAFAYDQVQALANNQDLYNHLYLNWVLFPDHAVFLGPQAFTYSSWQDFLIKEKNNFDKPELIFIENVGVFVRPDFNQAKTAQLICYYDVLSRVSPDAKLDPLDEKSINALLDWEAEKYRKIMMR